MDSITDYIGNLFKPEAGVVSGDPLGTGALTNTAPDILRPVDSSNYFAGDPESGLAPGSGIDFNFFGDPEGGLAPTLSDAGQDFVNYLSPEIMDLPWGDIGSDVGSSIIEDIVPFLGF
jgi:hypothetical protein